MRRFHFYRFPEPFRKNGMDERRRTEFDTLAGFILHQLKRIPHADDKFEWEGFTIEIIDMDAQRIDKVLVNISNEIKENKE